MINTDVKAALVNYHENKRAIRIDLENIEVVRNQKSKTGGSIAKIVKNSIQNDQKIIKNMDKEDFYLLELTNHRYLVSIADSFIEFCKGEIRDIVIDLYINGFSLNTDFEIKFSRSKSQIYKDINNQVNKFVDKMNC